VPALFKARIVIGIGQIIEALANESDLGVGLYYTASSALRRRRRMIQRAVFIPCLIKPNDFQLVVAVELKKADRAVQRLWSYYVRPGMDG